MIAAEISPSQRRIVSYLTALPNGPGHMVSFSALKKACAATAPDVIALVNDGVLFGHPREGFYLTVAGRQV